MEANEFFKRVKDQAGLRNKTEATNAARATLETLAEHLSGGEAENLSAQLPREVGRYLIKGAGAQPAQAFSLDEFLNRVSEREGVGRAQAAEHARAVMVTLHEAVSGGESADMRAQLPREFDQLLLGLSGTDMPYYTGQYAGGELY